mmetsp:Transcript_35560/g.82585  ORF Transcript_35560/g.82585 Transcript_35560/m.82585 type:complete len:261 (-) Transcript_35560:401-1183(-)
MSGPSQKRFVVASGGESSSAGDSDEVSSAGDEESSSSSSSPDMCGPRRGYTASAASAVSVLKDSAVAKSLLFDVSPDCFLSIPMWEYALVAARAGGGRGPDVPVSPRRRGALRRARRSQARESYVRRRGGGAVGGLRLRDARRRRGAAASHGGPAGGDVRTGGRPRRRYGGDRRLHGAGDDHGRPDLFGRGRRCGGTGRECGQARLRRHPGRGPVGRGVRPPPSPDGTHIARIRRFGGELDRCGDAGGCSLLCTIARRRV